MLLKNNRKIIFFIISFFIIIFVIKVLSPDINSDFLIYKAQGDYIINHKSMIYNEVFNTPYYGKKIFITGPLYSIIVSAILSYSKIPITIKYIIFRILSFIIILLPIIYLYRKYKPKLDFILLIPITIYFINSRLYSMRPHIWSIAFFLITFIKIDSILSKKIGFSDILFLFIICTLWMNIHPSAILFINVFIVYYVAIFLFNKNKIKLINYIFIFILFLTTLLTPYGVNYYKYFFNHIFHNTTQNINEWNGVFVQLIQALQEFNVLSLLIILLLFTLPFVSMVFLKIKRYHFIFLTFLLFILCISFRNIDYYIPFLSFIFIYYRKNMTTKKNWNIITFINLIIIFFYILPISSENNILKKKYYDSLSIKMMNYIKKNCDGNILPVPFDIGDFLLTEKNKSDYIIMFDGRRGHLPSETINDYNDYINVSEISYLKKYNVKYVLIRRDFFKSKVDFYKFYTIPEMHGKNFVLVKVK